MLTSLAANRRLRKTRAFSNRLLCVPRPERHRQSKPHLLFGLVSFPGHVEGLFLDMPSERHVIVPVLELLFGMRTFSNRTFPPTTQALSFFMREKTSSSALQY